MSNANTQQWYTLVPGKVYLSMGTGKVTTEMMQKVDEEIIAFIEASDAPLVHIIHDTRYIQSLPSLNDVRSTKYPYHPRLGYNVSVGTFSNALMRFVVGMATAIMRARSADVSTLQEAYTYLIERDPSLPPLSTWTLPPENNTAAS